MTPEEAKKLLENYDIWIAAMAMFLPSKKQDEFAEKTKKFIVSALDAQKIVDAEIVQETYDFLQGGLYNEVLKVIFEETKKKILNQ